METFVVLTTGTMKSVTFWVVMPSSSWNSTDISEERIASIFRVEELAKQEAEASRDAFFKAKEN
jgi:hypothetical protein